MIKKLQDKRSNKKWTAKEIQDLLQFKSQGFNNSEIGAYLQRSEKAIDLKMSKLRTAIKGAAKLTWVIWVGAICGVFWIGTMVGKIL